MNAEWFDSLCAQWFAWLAVTTLQATILLGIAWGIDRCFTRRGWPQLLATLWWLALARFALPPTLTSPVSFTDTLGATTLDAASVTPSATLLRTMFIVWSSGALFVLVARFLRRRQLARRLQVDVELHPAWTESLERAAQTLNVRRLPRFARMHGLGSPAVFGVFRPSLILPAESLRRRPSQLDRHAVLHEMAHISRRDLLVDELLAVLRALLWFHPLVWIASVRLHQLSELACDARVAHALGKNAPHYRDTLLRAARSWIEAQPMSEVRAFLGRPATLLVRIERLEREPSVSPRWVRAASAVVTVLVAACVLPMAPRVDELRRQAERVFELERSGVPQSCFTLQAAAQVLAASSESPPSPEKH